MKNKAIEFPVIVVAREFIFNYYSFVAFLRNLRKDGSSTRESSTKLFTLFDALCRALCRESTSRSAVSRRVSADDVNVIISIVGI